MITNKIIRSRIELGRYAWDLRFGRIVTTNGCFDILHRGHVEYLNEASKLGNIFVVGINSDNSVRALKGKNRPINNENDRAYVLAGLQFVNAVYVFDELTPIEFIKAVNPSIHVKGGDYKVDELPESKIVQTVTIPIKTEISTSDIISRIRS